MYQNNLEKITENHQEILIRIVIVLSLQHKTKITITMKRYKANEVIKLLEADAWYLDNWTGDHRQFRHPIKKTKVTVSGKLSHTLSQELLNNIWKQAGWK